MRILYFSRDYTTHDRRFLLKMAESRHEIFFLRLENDGLRYEERPLAPGVTPVVWRGGGARASQPQQLLALMPDLERVLETVRPDLVHAGPVQTCGWMTALTGFHPFMIMSWGSDLLVDADRDATTAWITKHALRSADDLLCDCDAVRDKARALAPFSDEHVVQFPWGIDLRQFAPGPRHLGLRAQPGWNDATVVLSTRTWEPIYGIETLLRGFARAQRDEARLRLVLLGNGSLANQVDAIIRDSHLDELVLRPGMVSHAQLPDYFREADVYLSCTLSDGASISLLEAMATGLVVVVVDAPGNREWVTHGENGWLAPGGDPAMVAEALLHAAHLDPPRRAAVAATNRGIAEARADWDRNAAKLIAAYDRIERTVRAGRGS